jgi:hypothetical protein
MPEKVSVLGNPDHRVAGSSPAGCKSSLVADSKAKLGSQCLGQKIALSQSLARFQFYSFSDNTCADNAACFRVGFAAPTLYKVRSKRLHDIFQQPSKIVPKDSTKHSSVAKEPKKAGSFKVAKDWFGEVRQYFFTLGLVVTAILAFRTVLIQKLGWPEWSITLAFVPPLLVFVFRTVPRVIQRWHEERFIKIAASSTVTGAGFDKENRTRRLPFSK